MLFNFWLVLWQLHLLTLLIVLWGQTTKGIKGMERTVEDVGRTGREGKGGRGGTVSCIKLIVLNGLGYELIKTCSCIACVVHGASMAVMGKSQIKSHSKISNLLHWRFKSSSQISNLESNLTPKSWILKLQISNQISNPETTEIIIIQSYSLANIFQFYWLLA